MSLNRRRFVQTLGAGTVFAPSSLGSAAPERVQPQASAAIELCAGWSFRFDPQASLDLAAVLAEKDDWQTVNVPHTWQSLIGGSHPAGVGWYKRELPEASTFTHMHRRLEFEAVAHTAHVWLNGVPIGEHVGKGYTAFECDLGSAFQPSGKNLLLVRVDNRPSDTMLPRNRSYDWADDGGIVRPAHLLATPRVYVQRVEIDAVLQMEAERATVTVRVHVRNTTDRAERVSLAAFVKSEAGLSEVQTFSPVQASVAADTTTIVSLSSVIFEHPLLWHFDTPHLYTANIVLRSPAGEHLHAETFGIRSFEVRGTSFFLNGAKVSLVGVERMAGSHPDFGMAETADWIRRNHEDMKELNCLYTRVHWPQDRRVLDFCDRHGILMQEEVPAWGPETFLHLDDALQQKLEQNGVEQMQEMIARDRNHPCIIAWGLCNEVDGKNPRSRRFAHRMSDEAHRLDPRRLQTYASHSLGTDPGADMAGDFDFVSTNEYYGSWTPGGPAQVQAHLDRIRRAFRNKPIVVSEYGWCECQPSIMPGDDNRVDIVNAHTDLFRARGDIAGAIYFDYNDYRTLVGDKGQGSMRQRVHGVVDLYASRKPSFGALRRQCSPIETLRVNRTDADTFSLEIATRTSLPSYTLRGYAVRWVFYGYDDLPMGGLMLQLADTGPGEKPSLTARCSAPDIRRVVVDVLRPQGDSVARIEWLGIAALS